MSFIYSGDRVNVKAIWGKKGDIQGNGCLSSNCENNTKGNNLAIFIISLAFNTGRSCFRRFKISFFKDMVRAYSGIFLSHEKEWRAVYRYRDGPRDYRTKGSQAEEDNLNTYHIPYTWDVKYDTN